MINFEKHHKIKVRNEEEFLTVLDDLTNQDALYHGLYLPKAKFVTDNSKRTFPLYVKVSGTGKNLSFSLADPSSEVGLPLSSRHWYLTLDQIESDTAPAVVLDQAEWEELKPDINDRIKEKRREMGLFTTDSGFTQQEVDARIARNKGQMFGLKKGFDLIKHSPSGYKVEFKMDAEELSYLLLDFNNEVDRIREEASKLAKLKHYSHYSGVRITARVSYLQGKMSGLQEVANLLDGYYGVKVANMQREEEVE